MASRLFPGSCRSGDIGQGHSKARRNVWDWTGTRAWLPPRRAEARGGSGDETSRYARPPAGFPDATPENASAGEHPSPAAAGGCGWRRRIIRGSRGKRWFAPRNASHYPRRRKVAHDTGTKDTQIETSAPRPLKYNQTGPDSTGKTGFAPALQNRGQVTPPPYATQTVLDCGGKRSATPLSDHPQPPPTITRPGKSGVAVR